MRTSRIRAAVTAIVLTATAVVMAAGGARAATPLPAHVYAPYFETWTSDSIKATSDSVRSEVLHAGIPRDDR